MHTVASIEALRASMTDWRAAGERIAFVPTMGNLHQGHLRLIERARELADRVVVSIFVNPLQFSQNEDLASYPNTPEEDAAQLQACQTDLLFRPGEAEMYPAGRERVTWVEVPGLSDILCGASRPGHFRGVATVVCKLFNIVQPDIAVFGEKDYQQLCVLRRMVNDLCMPVTIVGLPTVREADGLAMSSRNGYLNREERAAAPVLYQTLSVMADALRGGDQRYAELEAAGAEMLEAAGLRPDYVSIRRADDLGPPELGEQQLVVLVAAYLGRARLIDNMVVIGAGIEP